MVGLGGTPLTVVSFWFGRVRLTCRWYTVPAGMSPLTTEDGVEDKVATGVWLTRGVEVPPHTPVETVQATVHCVTVTANPSVVLVVRSVLPVPVTPRAMFFPSRVPPLVRST